MTWNFRVVKTVYKAGTPDEETCLAIHEVYYDDNGNATGVTVDAVAVVVDADDHEWSMEKEFAAQMKALTLPVLNFEDFDTKEETDLLAEETFTADEVRAKLSDK